MLAILGAGAIVVLLAVILLNRCSPLVALILVPVVAALLGGFGLQTAEFAVEGITRIAPMVAMFVFAILFFGVMTDAGLLDPIISRIVRAVGDRPRRIVVASAFLALLVHLDGSGAVCFLVVIPAMLPLYERLRLDKRVLACVVSMAAGVNFLPWTGPMVRASAALDVPVAEIFRPLIPVQIVGLVFTFAAAWWLGVREERRIARLARTLPTTAEPPNQTSEPSQSSEATRSSEASRFSEAAQSSEANRSSEPNRLTEPSQSPHPTNPIQPSLPVPTEQQALRRPHLFWINLALTLVVLGTLVAGIAHPGAIFMTGAALALVICYPKAREQRERVEAHARAALSMAAILLAAGVFTGIMTGMGALKALAMASVSAVPTGLESHIPFALSLIAMPLSMVFDPDSFYFGVLPVIAETYRHLGGEPIQVGQAALIGQMTAGFPVSPLTPATFLVAGLTGLDLGTHQRFTFPFLYAASLCMALACLVFGVFPL